MAPNAQVKSVDLEPMSPSGHGPVAAIGIDAANGQAGEGN
jgi:hypothetical protein